MGAEPGLQAREGHEEYVGVDTATSEICYCRSQYLLWKIIFPRSFNQPIMIYLLKESFHIMCNLNEGLSFSCSSFSLERSEPSNVCTPCPFAVCDERLLMLFLPLPGHVLPRFHADSINPRKQSQVSFMTVFFGDERCHDFLRGPRDFVCPFDAFPDRTNTISVTLVPMCKIRSALEMNSMEDCLLPAPKVMRQTQLQGLSES